MSMGVGGIFGDPSKFGGPVNPLEALLRQVTQQQQAEPEGEPIVVQGARAGRNPLAALLDEEAYAMPDVAPPLGNNQWIEEGVAAQENAPQRKGMFGMKGTLRDVLGTIGDAFLVQSGNDRVYAPRRQQERAMDAMAGATANPRAAAERMTQVDPNAAFEMIEKLGVQEARQQQAQALAEKARLDNYEKGSALFSQYIAGADPETYSRMRPLLAKLKQNFGLGDEFMVPETYDEALAESYGRGAMKTSQQVTTQQGDRRLDMTEDRNKVLERQGDTRNAISQQRANRPPAGRAAPNPTAASIAAPLLRKVQNGGTLTKAEQEVLDRTGYSADRGKSSSGSRSGNRRSVTPPSRFRPVR